MQLPFAVYILPLLCPPSQMQPPNRTAHHITYDADQSKTNHRRQCFDITCSSCESVETPPTYKCTSFSDEFLGYIRLFCVFPGRRFVAFYGSGTFCAFVAKSARFFSLISDLIRCLIQCHCPASAARWDVNSNQSCRVQLLVPVCATIGGRQAMAGWEFSFETMACKTSPESIEINKSRNQ